MRTSSEAEGQRVLKMRLLDAVRRYDGLDRWLFTHEVQIDDSNFSHSHPVLTLGTGGEAVKSDLGLLSVFLHEQMHWHLSQHPDRLKLALKDVRSRYPDVKVGSASGGARDEQSTHLHLLVCLLEVDALTELIGKKKALDLILAKPYYRWIYGKVAADYQGLGRIVSKRGLSLRKPSERWTRRTRAVATSDE